MCMNRRACVLVSLVSDSIGLFGLYY